MTLSGSIRLSWNAFKTSSPKIPRATSYGVRPFKLSRSVELMWLVIRFTSHWVRKSKVPKRFSKRSKTSRTELSVFRFMRNARNSFFLVKKKVSSVLEEPIAEWTVSISTKEIRSGFSFLYQMLRAILDYRLLHQIMDMLMLLVAVYY